MKRHLIWDFDGTMYNTYPQMTKALLAALEDYGDTAEYGEACALMKKTLFTAVNVYAERFGHPADALMAAFRAHHAAQQCLPVMPGLRECLAETARLGCRHYLFTHRDRRAVEQMAMDGLLSYFAECVTREDGFADKPSPEAPLHLMRGHGFAAQDAYMIGDRDIDIASGRAAGIAGILLDPDGYYPDLAVEHRIGSLPEIPALLQCDFKSYSSLNRIT